MLTYVISKPITYGIKYHDYNQPYNIKKKDCNKSMDTKRLVIDSALVLVVEFLKSCFANVEGN